MRVIEPGHVYELEEFSDLSSAKGGIRFYNIDGNAMGTTNEEVLTVLIDRMIYLNSKVPCRENSIVITKLEEAYMWLQHRTEDRQARGVEGTNTK